MTTRLEFGAVPVESADHERKKARACSEYVLALERKLNSQPCISVTTQLVQRVTDIATKCLQNADGRTSCDSLCG